MEDVEIFSKGKKGKRKERVKGKERKINKGINDKYLWVLHGSDVELHVGGADQQELEQQGLSNLVGRDRGFIMLD